MCLGFLIVKSHIAAARLGYSNATARSIFASSIAASNPRPRSICANPLEGGHRGMMRSTVKFSGSAIFPPLDACSEKRFPEIVNWSTPTVSCSRVEILRCAVRLLVIAKLSHTGRRSQADVCVQFAGPYYWPRTPPAARMASGVLTSDSVSSSKLISITPISDVSIKRWAPTSPRSPSILS